jgi:hypothetical protein
VDEHPEVDEVGGLAPRRAVGLLHRRQRGAQRLGILGRAPLRR